MFALKIKNYLALEILDYIQNNLRAYAMKMTEWKYDADDFVQETALQFLSHNYGDLEIKHQKNVAKKIMRHLFLLNGLRGTQQRILFYKAWNEQHDFTPQYDIDVKALQQFLKERNDYQINIFWLYNIGYTLDELERMFSLKRSTIHCMIYNGKVKLLKIMRGQCVKGKEATRLDWNRRRKQIPFLPV